uniref:Methyltransferase type 11 domain-containing protein n=1 Tax=Fusarium oxysporum (strain Fo5176) TaxID=660025 RepID=A0A0D2YAY8_FUSOF
MALDETTPVTVTGDDDSTTAQPLHPVTHWEQLNEEVEAQDNDADSLISDPAESTASMTSSILSYRTIQGRTFHSERGNAQYWASNDEQQNESMDIVYLGYPWTFAPDSIDFVHMRYLFGSIKDWSALFKEAFRTCRPGGWVESHEASAMMESDDGTVTDTSAMHEWGRFFIEGGKKMGQPCTIIEDDLQQKCMREAGFEDIQVADYKVRVYFDIHDQGLAADLQIAIGGWPKDKKMREIGQYVLAALEQDFEGYVLYMASQLLGWSMQEVKVYCAQLRRELRSTANHPFFRYRAVYGRKPQTP